MRVNAISLFLHTHTAGPKAAGKNAVIGGLVLAMIEGASIAITKVRRGKGGKIAASIQLLLRSLLGTSHPVLLSLLSIRAMLCYVTYSSLHRQHQRQTWDQPCQVRGSDKLLYASRD